MKMQFNILLSIICSVASAEYTNKYFHIPKGNFLPARLEMTPQLYFNAFTDVKFELYTLENPTEAQILSPENIKSITESNLNPNIPTRVIIHGWQERGDMKRILLQAYFQKANLDVNLIIVNWERLSHTLNYMTARNSVEDTGVRVANMIGVIVERKQIPLDNIGVVGFSLGAHIAGHAGKFLKSGKLPKITGLDPAGPLFDCDKPESRLDKNDAKYVEIIHTNGGQFGFFDPCLGMINFFVNGGRTQIRCVSDPTGICSHISAYYYFALSIISTEPIVGHYCESMVDIEYGTCSPNGKTAIMGGEPGPREQPEGIYYVSLIE